jgi:hypothetical protein
MRPAIDFLIGTFCDRRPEFKALHALTKEFLEMLLVWDGEIRWIGVPASNSDAPVATYLKTPEGLSVGLDDLGDSLIRLAEGCLLITRNKSLLPNTLDRLQREAFLRLKILYNEYERPFPRRDTFPSADPGATCLVSGSRNTLALG